MRRTGDFWLKLGMITFLVISEGPARTMRPPAAEDVIDRLLADTRSRPWQEAWDRGSAPADDALAAADVLVVLVPGFAYRSLEGNGADLARPKRALEAVGFRCELAPLRDTASIETNAMLLRDFLRECRHARIWLISASSGGPVAAEAISQLAHDSGAPSRIKAWVNIGGLLRGTALADDAVAWPKRWFARVMFRLRGWDFEAVRSLTTARRRDRARSWVRPDGLTIVNVVGVPRNRGEVSDRAISGYRRLAQLGANDGLTLITDALVPDAITVVAAGYDHFLLDPEIDRRTRSLALKILQGKQD